MRALSGLDRRSGSERAHFEGSGRGPGSLMTNGADARDHPGTRSPDVLWLRPPGMRAVPLRFWTDGSFLYFVATTSSRRWSNVTLRFGGCEIVGENGTARPCSAAMVMDPAEAGRVRTGIQDKYGGEAWIRHFHLTDRIIRLDPHTPPVALSAHERSRREFDAIAPYYTQTVTANPLQRYLKERTATRLVAELSGVDPLLEIGPGTGFETLPLLAAGHRIVAVDISAGMLAELEDRARSAGVAERLVTRVAPLSDLGRAVDDFGPAAFGGACSTFGAFNLENDFSECGEALGRAIRPGGRLIFTSLIHPGAAPLTWELFLGHVREASARLHREVPPDGTRYSLDVHLRNPGFWDQALAPAFERCDVRPVSVLTPPFDSPRLIRVLSSKGRRTARALDAVLSSHGLLSPFAEWVLLTYRRRWEVGATTPGLLRASASS